MLERFPFLLPGSATAETIQPPEPYIRESRMAVRKDNHGSGLESDSRTGGAAAKIPTKGIFQSDLLRRKGASSY